MRREMREDLAEWAEICGAIIAVLLVISLLIAAGFAIASHAPWALWGYVPLVAGLFIGTMTWVDDRW